MSYFEREQKKQKINKANKRLKRNTTPKPPRQKRWVDVDIEDIEEQAGFEQIMLPGENDRRKRVERLAAEISFDKPSDDAPSPTDDLLRGLVIETSNSMYRVQVTESDSAEKESIFLCDLCGTLSAAESAYINPVAVGDHVQMRRKADDQGIIEAVLPRRNAIVRPATFYKHLNQVLAANVDQVLIVASWDAPQFWPALVDRYLISAWRLEIEPILCINKIDLAQDPLDMEETVKLYQDLGLQVLLTSVVTLEGLTQLRTALAGKISVLSGMSGVGKSSLLTAAQPDFNLRVGEVSDQSGEGKHTTTQALMLPYGQDGYVIDTPGIRDFGLRNLPAAELIVYYPDFAPHAAKCRFRACSHVHEPNCGVLAAVETGAIPTWRYESYLRIWETLE